MGGAAGTQGGTAQQGTSWGGLNQGMYGGYTPQPGTQYYSQPQQQSYQQSYPQFGSGSSPYNQQGNYQSSWYGAAPPWGPAPWWATQPQQQFQQPNPYQQWSPWWMSQGSGGMGGMGGGGGWPGLITPGGYGGGGWWSPPPSGGGAGTGTGTGTTQTPGQPQTIQDLYNQIMQQYQQQSPGSTGTGEAGQAGQGGGAAATGDFSGSNGLGSLGQGSLSPGQGLSAFASGFAPTIASFISNPSVMGALNMGNPFSGNPSLTGLAGQYAGNQAGYGGIGRAVGTLLGGFLPGLFGVGNMLGGNLYGGFQGVQNAQQLANAQMMQQLAEIDPTLVADMAHGTGSFAPGAQSAPGIAGLTSQAAAQNMTLGQSLGLGAGSAGLSGMAPSDLGNLMGQLGIANTPANISSLRGVNSETALQAAVTALGGKTGGPTGPGPNAPAAEVDTSPNAGVAPDTGQGPAAPGVGPAGSTGPGSSSSGTAGAGDNGGEGDGDGDGGPGDFHTGGRITRRADQSKFKPGIQVTAHQGEYVLPPGPMAQLAAKNLGGKGTGQPKQPMGDVADLMTKRKKKRQ